jgi:hypothetical protein
MPDISLRAQLACARRELALRVCLYPRLVARERSQGVRGKARGADPKFPPRSCSLPPCSLPLQGLVEGAAPAEDGQGEVFGGKTGEETRV